jgi:plastocyanin
VIPSCRSLYAARGAGATRWCQTVDMRPGLRITRAVVAVGASVWALTLPTALPAHAATKQVSAGGGNTFSPGTVTIKVGDTVVWTNTGGVGHTVTSWAGDWSKDRSIPAPTTNTSYTFDAPGTYRYYCRTHGTATGTGMRGVVTVTGTAPKPTKTPTPTKTSVKPRPTTTATRTAAPSGTPGTPTPSTSSGGLVLPSTTIPPARTSGPPLPSVAPPQSGRPRPTESFFLGEGGLRPQAPTGRGRGLPLLVSLVLVLGVGSAEVRALLAHAPR